MGQDVLSVQQLTHGYQDRTLFKNCNFEMEKSERVALIGMTSNTSCNAPPCAKSFCWSSLVFDHQTDLATTGHIFIYALRSAVCMALLVLY